MSISQRIDAITDVDGPYKGTILPAPRSVKIELTARCNYKCSFCVKSLRADDGEMDRALYSRIIRELRASGVEELGVFFIGESMLCKWLPDAIAEAKEVGFPYVFLTTNGSAATPSNVLRCMEAGLDSLKFSVNFDTPQQLENIAQVSPRFWDAALRNLEHARKLRDECKHKTRIYASAIQFTGDQAKRMAEVVETRIKPFVDEFYWLPLFSMSGASIAAGMKPRAGNPGRLGQMREPLPCWSVFTEGHVTKDGLMTACCFGAGLDGDLVMGDLKSEAFLSAWNSEAYQKLRAAHLAKNVSGTACGSCVAGGG